MNKKQIIADMNDAMKKGDKAKLSTVRLLLSEIKNAEIKKGAELTDDEITTVIGREAKKRREAIPLYRQGGREELAAKEELELAVLLGYLPAQLTETELNDLVDEAVRDCGATSMKEMGKVMAMLAPKIKGRADGAVVGNLVKARLAG